MRKLLNRPDRTSEMGTVEALLPNSLLSDASMLAQIAGTLYESSHPEAPDMTGLHLACSTLSMRVINAFLQAIGYNPPTVNIRSRRGESLLQFILQRHSRWNNSMVPIMKALVKHGYSMDASDMQLYGSDTREAIAMLSKYARSIQTAQELHVMLCQLPPADAAEILFASRDYLVRCNIDIFQRNSPDRPSTVEKLLMRISGNQFPELIEWVHTHYPNEFTRKLFLMHKFRSIIWNSISIETALADILQQLNKADLNLLDRAIWLDTFRTRKHSLLNEVPKREEELDIRKTNPFSLWHLLPLQCDISICVLRWLLEQKFDFTFTDTSSNETIFSGLHVAFLVLNGNEHVPLLHQILSFSYEKSNTFDWRDLNLARMAQNRHAVKWLLARDGQHLCSQHIDIPANQFTFYMQYSRLPLALNLQNFSQLTSHGLISLQHNADLLALPITGTNDEIEKDLVVQRCNVFPCPAPDQDFTVGCSERFLVQISMKYFGSPSIPGDNSDTVVALHLRIYPGIPALLGSLILTTIPEERVLAAGRLVGAGLDPNEITQIEALKASKLLQNSLNQQVLALLEEVTPLAYAVAIADDNLVKQLLDLGVNPCQVCEIPISALNFFSISGNLNPVVRKELRFCSIIIYRYFPQDSIQDSDPRPT